MSMPIDHAGHGCCDTVRQNEHQQNESAKSRDDAIQEAMREWIYALIMQGFKGLGKTEDKDNEGKGGRDVSETGPISMDELSASAMSTMEATDATIMEGTEILEQLFGANLADNNSIYFDEGVNDQDLVNLFGGKLPVAPSTLSSGATSDRGEPDAVIGGNTPSQAAEEAETPPPPPMETGDFDPLFGDESIYGLAALVLLTTMENKRNIISNRLSQIEETNRKVQEITNQISNLKAAKTGLDTESSTKEVNVSALVTLANNNTDSTGGLDEDGTEKFLAELGLESDDIIEIMSGSTEDGQTIKLSKAQIDAIIEKLTSQSEALSTQNQTRNIKLQQQISELQVSTQMTSAIIDQIKTLGSGIAQRL